MSQLFFFRAEVILRVRAGSHFARYPLGYAYSGTLESLDFIGIVREQAHGMNAEALENFGGQGEVAVVGFETEAFVGFDSIKAGVLKFVGLEFCHKTDAAAFL